MVIPRHNLLTQLFYQQRIYPSKTEAAISAIVMDTLEFATRLKAGGFTDQQAETQVRAFADVVEK
jgi:hypothetical protein